MPICWLKTFKFISYISFFANISIIFALFVIVAYSEKEYVAQPELHKQIRYLNISQLPIFFGVAVFNFEGNGVIINLESAMADSSNFNRVLRNVLFGVIFILITFSCYSYMSFGDTIEDMVTLNLPHDNLTSTVQLMYCIGLLGSYPMQVIPAIDITEKTSWFLNSPNPFEKVNPYLKNIVSRTAIVLLTGILAQIVPKFGLFISLSGAFACTALAFIMPTLMFNKLYASEITPKRRFGHKLLIFFGILCGTISFIMTSIEIIKAFSE